MLLNVINMLLICYLIFHFLNLIKIDDILSIPYYPALSFATNEFNNSYKMLPKS